MGSLMKSGNSGDAARSQRKSDKAFKKQMRAMEPPELPELPPPTRMPTMMDQQVLTQKKRTYGAGRRRRGRLATILTNQSITGGSLGG